MKVTFEIQATEKLTDSSGLIVSGETIHYASAVSESNAKKIGERFLKQANVLAVFIQKYQVDEMGDPLYQWIKYEDDSKWSGANYW